jgi:hypothetical protein
MKKDLLSNPENVKFDDLIKICTDYFGIPRIKALKKLEVRDENQ